MRTVLGLLVAMAATAGAPHLQSASSQSACGGQRDVWRAAYTPSRPFAQCAHAIGTVALPRPTAAVHT